MPDFLKPGILFRDITPVMEDPELNRAVVDGFLRAHQDQHIDAIAGIGEPGFSTACHSRCNWASPSSPCAKMGKLPHRTVSFKYDLEYGSAEIEMHVDVVKPGMRAMHDDLLATGVLPRPPPNWCACRAARSPVSASSSNHRPWAALSA
ncbi:MAG: hypothetical protein R2810_00740 [Flavobacteriales bacterium]